MALEVADVLIGPAIVYTGPLGSTLPADTVAVDTPWGGSWVRFGFTSSPLTFAYEYEVVEPKIQEVLGSLKRAKSSEKLNLETTIAELDFTQMQFAWGGGTVTAIAAAAGVPEASVMKLGGQRFMLTRAIGFEAQRYDEETNTIYPIRLLIYRGTGSAGGSLEFSKDDYTGTALKIGALEDISKPRGERLFEFRKVTGPAL